MGLELIARNEQSSIGATYLDWDNIFSADYQDYRLSIDEIKGTGTSNVYVRLIDNAGTVITGTEYNQFSWLHRSYSAPSATDYSINSDNLGLVGYTNINGTQTGKPFSLGSQNVIYNPYESSKQTAMVGRDFNTGEGYDSTTTEGHGVGRTRSGFHETIERIRGLRFYVIAGNIDSFKATLYGYKI